MSIETSVVFEEKVALTARDFGNPKINIQKMILGKLAQKLESKCSVHGWVRPKTLRILSRSMGYVEKGRFTGDIVFHVQAEGRVFNPPSGAEVVGTVTGNNKMGMYVNVEDAIKVILPRDLHIGEEYADFHNTQIGEKVRLEIKKSRFQVNDEFILSVGLFLGKVGKDYVAPVREIVEDINESDTLLAEEAKKRLEMFKQTEREIQEGKVQRIKNILGIEEPVRQEDEIPPLEKINQTNALKQMELIESRKPLPPRVDTLFEPETSGEPLYIGGEDKTYDMFLPTYMRPFTAAGKVWPSVEHYYEAKKFVDDEEYQEKIRSQPTTALASRLGRMPEGGRKVRDDWNSIQEEMMYDGYRAQFRQHKDMMDALQATDPRPIIYQSDADPYWGSGITGKGKNRLGYLLMKLRSVGDSTMENID